MSRSLPILLGLLLSCGCSAPQHSGGPAESTPIADADACDAPQQGIVDLAGMIASQHARRAREEYSSAYSRRDVAGQNPHILFVGCSDSYCGGAFDSLGIRPAPNRVFKGDNPGNLLFTRVVEPESGQKVLDGASSVSYFVNHIAHLGGHAPVSDAGHSKLGHGAAPDEVYCVIIEGHTMCGAMNALLGGIDGEDPGLREHLAILRDGTAETIEAVTKDEHLEPLARNAILSQAAVDYQVQEFMRLYPNFVASGRGIVVGMIRDLTDHFFCHGEGCDDRPSLGEATNPRGRGHVYVTNVNGVTDHKKLCEVLEERLGERVDGESLDYVARRVHVN